MQNTLDKLGFLDAAFNATVMKVASTADLTAIAITGESGTGKDLVAKALHDNSSRRDVLYLTMNAGALLNKDLVRSELFGYEKGSFTGADHMGVGLLEKAIKGTVFIDEFGASREVASYLEQGLRLVLGSHAPVSANRRIDDSQI